MNTVVIQRKNGNVEVLVVNKKTYLADEISGDSNLAQMAKNAMEYGWLIFSEGRREGANEHRTMVFLVETEHLHKPDARA